MTFDELNAKYNGTLTKTDWYQHKNGNGWIYKDSTITDETIFIGEKAVVWGGTIEGGTIWGGTIWGGTIRGGTIWGGTIRGGTIEDGTISGGEWKTTPLFVCGTKHSLSNAKPGHLQIGCKCEPFAWWLTDEAKQFAMDNGYTESEQEEYRAYIELFIKLGK